MPDAFNKFYNPFVAFVLRSPLHRVLDEGVMLVTYQGRKSGKTFSTPVNYLRDGDTLWTVSFRHRSWWRNLLGGACVTLHWRGKDYPAIAQVTSDDEGVTASLQKYLQHKPQFAPYLGVHAEANGNLNTNDIRNAAKTRVMVQFRILEENSARGE